MVQPPSPLVEPATPSVAPLVEPAPSVRESQASAPPDVGEALASAPPDAGEALASAAPDAGEALASAPPDVGEALASAAPDVGYAEADPAPPSSLDDAGPSPSLPSKAIIAKAAAVAIIVAFEGPAAVIRGPSQKGFFQRSFPLLFSEREFISFSEVQRWVVVADGAVLVYVEQTDPAPLYTIDMTEGGGLEVEIEDPEHPDFYSRTVSHEAKGSTNKNKSQRGMKTVLLRNRGNGKKKEKVAYQLSFDERGAEDFVAAVRESRGRRYSTKTVKVSAGTAGQEKAAGGYMA